MHLGATKSGKRAELQSEICKAYAFKECDYYMPNNF
jgi:hypothetical protein